MKRSPLVADPARAADRRLRREQRRAGDPPRPEDVAREGRRMAREAAKTRVPLKRSRPEPVALRPPRAEWDVKTRMSACAMCGTRTAVTGHHVLPLQALKKNGVPRELWYSPKNHLPLCLGPEAGNCHARHENYIVRVPRAVVLAKAPEAIDFADEVGLLHLFEREYPA